MNSLNPSDAHNDESSDGVSNAPSSETANTTADSATTATTPEDELLAKLRLPQTYADAAVGVKKPLLTVGVRKPNKAEFFRVHPDHFLDCCMLEDKLEREHYFVLPDLAAYIAEFVEGVRLHLCVTRQEVAFLWPVKLPRDDRRSDAWRKSAAESASLAQDQWLRIHADMNLGAYQPYVATASLGEPKWPETPWPQVLQIATRDRMIEDAQHPLVRRLLGQV